MIKELKQAKEQADERKDNHNQADDVQGLDDPLYTKILSHILAQL